MLVLDMEPERFEFELDGKVYSVTPLNALPYDTAKTLRDVGSDAEAVEWIEQNVFEKEAPEAMRRLTVGQWKMLLGEYLNGGPAPGESAASSS